MTLREKVARAIAEAKTGLDPESRTIPFRPMAVTVDGDVLVPPEDAVVPLWTRYLGAADAAIAAIKDRFEVANVFADLMKDMGA